MISIFRLFQKLYIYVRSWTWLLQNTRSGQECAQSGHLPSVRITLFSYKELALKYHPGLKHDNENESYKKFCLISEAFDILYSDQKREIYDKHGEQKLKEGVVNNKGERELGEYTLTTEP